MCIDANTYAPLGTEVFKGGSYSRPMPYLR
jgi:hypothetical protein